MEGSPKPCSFVYASYRDGANKDDQQVKEHAEALERKLEELFPGEVNAIGMVPDGLSVALRSPGVRFVHIRTHGSKQGSGALLHSLVGEEKRVFTVENLVNLIKKAHRDEPTGAFEVLFLSACEDWKTVEACAELLNVHAVVGYHVEMPSDEALGFEIAFYECLKRGDSIEEAVEEASCHLGNNLKMKVNKKGQGLWHRPFAKNVGVEGSIQLKWTELGMYLGIGANAHVQAVAEPTEWVAEAKLSVVRLRHGNKYLRWNDGVVKVDDFNSAGQGFDFRFIRDGDRVILMSARDDLPLCLSQIEPFGASFSNVTRLGGKVTAFVIEKKNLPKLFFDGQTMTDAGSFSGVTHVSMIAVSLEDEPAKEVKNLAPFNVISSWLNELETGGEISGEDALLFVSGMNDYVNNPDVIEQLFRVLDVQVKRNINIVYLILEVLMSEPSDHLFEWCLNHDLHGRSSHLIWGGKSSNDMIQFLLKKDGSRYYYILLQCIASTENTDRIRCRAIRETFSGSEWEQYFPEESILRFLEGEVSVDVLDEIILSLSNLLLSGSYNWYRIKDFLQGAMLDAKRNERVRYRSLCFISIWLKKHVVDTLLLYDLVSAWRLCSEWMEKAFTTPADFLNHVGTLKLSPNELKLFVKMCFSPDKSAPFGVTNALLYLLQYLGSSLKIDDLTCLFELVWSFRKVCALDGLLESVVLLDKTKSLRWKLKELRIKDEKMAAAIRKQEMAAASAESVEEDAQIRKVLMLEDLSRHKYIDEVRKYRFTVGDMDLLSSLFAICKEDVSDRNLESALTGMMHVCTSGVDESICEEISSWCLRYCGDHVGTSGAHMASEFVKRFASGLLWPSLIDLTALWSTRRGAIYCLTSSLPNHITCDDVIDLIRDEKNVELQNWMLDLLYHTVLFDRKRQYDTNKVALFLLSIGKTTVTRSMLLCLETVVLNEMPSDYHLILTRMIELSNRNDIASDKAPEVIMKMLQKADESVFRELVSVLANNLKDSESRQRWYPNLVQAAANEAVRRNLGGWLESLAKGIDLRAPVLARSWIDRLNPQDPRQYDIWKRKG